MLFIFVIIFISTQKYIYSENDRYVFDIKYYHYNSGYLFWYLNVFRIL